MVIEVRAEDALGVSEALHGSANAAPVQIIWDRNTRQPRHRGPKGHGAGKVYVGFRQQGCRTGPNVNDGWPAQKNADNVCRHRSFRRWLRGRRLSTTGSDEKNGHQKRKTQGSDSTNHRPHSLQSPPS